MTNAISKTTAHDVDKQQLVNRIIKNSTQLLEDYVLWNKCGWSDQEFGDLLGISAKTVKNRYLADARKQGLIEAGKCGKAAPAYQKDARFRESSVENSTPLNHPEIVKPHVSNAQPCDTSTSNSGGVSNVQSEMDSFSDRYDKDAVPMGSADDGRVAKDHEEVNRHIREIFTIFKRHYAPLEPGTFDGFHWTDFYEQFDSLRKTAEQYSREYRIQEKEYYDECLDNAKDWCDSNYGIQGSRKDNDGQLLRLVR